MNNLIAQGAPMPLGPLSGFLTGRNDAIGLEELGRQRKREDQQTQIQKWDFEQRQKDAEAFGDLKRQATAQGLRDDMELSPFKKEAMKAGLQATPELTQLNLFKQRLDKQYSQLGAIEELAQIPDLAFSDPLERKRIADYVQALGINAPEPGTTEWRQWIEAAKHHAQNTRPRLEEQRKQAHEMAKLAEQKSWEQMIHKEDAASRERIAQMHERGLNSRYNDSKNIPTTDKVDAIQLQRVYDKLNKGEPLNDQDKDFLRFYQYRRLTGMQGAEARNPAASALGLPTGEVPLPMGGGQNPATQSDVNLSRAVQGLPVDVNSGTVFAKGGQPIQDKNLVLQLINKLPDDAKIRIPSGVATVKDIKKHLSSGQ